MAAKPKKKKRRLIGKIVLLVLLLGLAVAGVTGWQYYSMIYQPNVTLNSPDNEYFYVPTGASYEAVANSLYEQNLVVNRSSFDWVAKRKNYHTLVKPGRYKLRNGMNNDELVNLLRSGVQEPIRLVFNNIRTREQLAVRIANQIEADSASIASALYDPAFAARYGFTTETFVAIFVPNTYELYWNTSTDQLFDRMAAEFKSFWTEERKARAAAIGLQQSEVVTLASIVEQETSKNDEKAVVAGVYMNRLRIKMPLQADPTLIYALGDYLIKRVLNIHKEIESPYNTYKYKGLPPGPICIPAISSIDAVLNYKTHDYIYFCAKEDFSGYHSFAANYNDHLVNARRYQRELDKRKIMS